ncbi:MAG TPA: hypothetical protein VG345_04390 [Bryobacteraceae bacterium]|nr:hypothetical protein [Bryobacteraceae bacterium]
MIGHAEAGDAAQNCFERGLLNRFEGLSSLRKLAVVELIDKLMEMAAGIGSNGNRSSIEEKSERGSAESGSQWNIDTIPKPAA